MLFLAGFLSHCDDGMTPEETEMFPESDLSFSLHIRPIFMQSCAFSGECHTGANPPNGLNLADPSPTFISDSPNVIVPFSASQSLLYQVLFEPVNNIRRMPLRGAALSDARTTAIGTWINEGALLN